MMSYFHLGADYEVQPEPKNEWFWWAGDNDEFFSCGPYKTREGAIADGQATFCGEGFHIVEARHAEYCMPAAEDVIGMMLEHSEVMYEDEPDVVGSKEVVKAAEAELDALLAGWLKKHVGIFSKPTLFDGTRNREFIPAQPEEE